MDLKILCSEPETPNGTPEMFITSTDAAETLETPCARPVRLSKKATR